MLLEKVYADGNKTTYTYTPEGQRLTRLWARGVDTIYTYDPASGDLTLIDYSDTTPDVRFMQYDSRGRPQTIIDGLGTRTLSYALGSALSADSLAEVTRTYTDGHLTGLSLGSDYSVSYSYDSYGRFGPSNALVAGAGAQSYTYSYLPDSDLLQQLTTSHGLVVTRAYEPYRDILTRVNNQFGTDVISQYDYVSDELARRTSMITSGLAFELPEPNPLSAYTNTYTTFSYQYSVISIWQKSRIP